MKNILFINKNRFRLLSLIWLGSGIFSVLNLAVSIVEKPILIFNYIIFSFLTIYLCLFLSYLYFLGHLKMYLRSILADLFFSNKIKSQKEIEISKPAIDKYAKSIFLGRGEVIYFIFNFVIHLTYIIFLISKNPFYYPADTGFSLSIISSFILTILVFPSLFFFAPRFLILSIRKYKFLSSRKKILLFIKCIFYFLPLYIFYYS